MKEKIRDLEKLLEALSGGIDWRALPGRKGVKMSKKSG